MVRHPIICLATLTLQSGACQSSGDVDCAEQSSACAIHKSTACQSGRSRIFLTNIPVGDDPIQLWFSIEEVEAAICGLPGKRSPDFASRKGMKPGVSTHWEGPCCG